jgi:hypothetical protein
MTKKTCFVIGPIGASPSPEREHADTFLKYIVEPCAALAKFSYAEPVRADQIALPGQITTQIVERLLNDDLVIADLTWHNANVFYELSLRHAIGKPVVQMVSGDTRLPFDVHASRTIPFSFDVREAEKAREALSLQISAINTPGYQPSNVIAEVATLIQIAKSGPPEMATVLRAVGDVAANVRLLTGEVQTLKQRGEAIVSLPTAGGPRPIVAGIAPPSFRGTGGITGLSAAFDGTAPSYSAGLYAAFDTTQTPLALREGAVEASDEKPGECGLTEVRQ